MKFAIAATLTALLTFYIGVCFAPDIVVVPMVFGAWAVVSIVVGIVGAFRLL